MNPAELQVLASRLQCLAEEMGTVLVRSARSANIKERRDCSTALFDASGEMIAQAEHQPAHLGAMPASVEVCVPLTPGPGDILVVNDPYRGGSHLPDVTLVSPIHLDGVLLGYAASRAHHADVGGAEPGSMPAGATSIFQEGIRIPPTFLVRGGELLNEVLALVLANVRNPTERLGDFDAQRAAHQIAERGLRTLARTYGAPRLHAGIEELLRYSERRMRAGIRLLPDGTSRAEDFMEGDGTHHDDIPVRVAVTVAGDAVVIDFAGSAPQQPGNVNCPVPVTRGACYFALRALCAPDLLASGGAFRPVEVRIPEDCLLAARYPAAVAAGNVETASRVADVVLAALSPQLEFMAQGQGTMNNLILGNHDFTYYETIGGGQGAHARGPGADAVHVAMSNTLNTPVEAFETEYPLRVELYAIRRGSGGRGRHRGGDGVVRSIRVLESCRLSILSERRRHAPQGLAGGGPGAPGINRVNGESLPAKVTRTLAAGDIVTIETPGGGGFGTPLRDDTAVGCELG